MWDFWTTKPPLNALISALPLLRPRRYSIASAPGYLGETWVALGHLKQCRRILNVCHVEGSFFEYILYLLHIHAYLSIHMIMHRFQLFFTCTMYNLCCKMDRSTFSFSRWAGCGRSTAAWSLLSRPFWWKAPLPVADGRTTAPQNTKSTLKT